jgi:hypothetical protein
MSLSLLETYESSEASEDDGTDKLIGLSQHADIELQSKTDSSLNSNPPLHGIYSSINTTLDAHSSPCKRHKGSYAVNDSKTKREVETDSARKCTIESLKEALIQIVPSESASSERSAAWKQFLKLLLNSFPELADSSCVEIFGSWTYQMWIESSDIDCNIRTRNCIANFFPRLKSSVCSVYPGATVRIIAKAKVPVAKIVLPHGLKIDVTHDYGIKEENERHNFLVRDWARRWQSNEVVCSSIRIIKQWATVNKIHDPCSGTLNSMGYLIMLIALLGPDEFNDRNSTTDQQLILENVLALLLRYFSSYQTLGRKREVICAPFGTVESEGLELDILRLSSEAEDRDHRGTGSTVFIQDPFLPSTNLGRFVDKYSAKVLRDCFTTAYKTLEVGGREAFQKLLRPNREKRL